jgi:anti-sigma B factor antagonist
LLRLSAASGLVLAARNLGSITGKGTRLRADGKRPVTTTAGGTMNFDIKTEQLGDDAYVISLAGEVDLYTAPEFKQQLLEVIGQGGKQVVVDFSGTTFIDSTTLGVLVGGVKRLRTNEGQLSLVCSDRNITKIFEITGLDRVFTIYPTRDEAVSKVKSADKPPA